MDDGIIGFLILIAVGIFFAPLILSIVALSRSGDLRRRLAKLESTLALYESGGVVAEPSPAADAAPAGATGKVWAEASQPAEKVAEAEPAPVIEKLEPVEAADAAPPIPHRRHAPA